MFFKSHYEANTLSFIRNRKSETGNNKIQDQKRRLVTKRINT
jgi:hypothetical protein